MADGRVNNNDTGDHLDRANDEKSDNHLVNGSHQHGNSKHNHGTDGRQKQQQHGDTKHQHRSYESKRNQSEKTDYSDSETNRRQKVDKHNHGNNHSTAEQGEQTDNNRDTNETKHEVKNIEGTVKNRKCRDVTFLVIFLASLGGMSFTSWRAHLTGNPLRIVYGTDSWGNICNQKNTYIPGIIGSGQNLSNTKFLYFFNSTVFEHTNTTVGTEFSIRVCVKSCPGTTLYTIEEVLNFTEITGASLCKYGTPPSDYGANDSYGFPVCPPVPVYKQEIFLNRCVPVSLTRRIEYVWSAINSLFSVFDDNLIEKAVSDITKVWVEILWLCGLSVGMGFVLVAALQFVAGYIIWFVILAVILGTLVATFICWFHFYKTFVKYHSISEDALPLGMEKPVRDWLIAASAVTIVTIIVLLVLFVIRRHIRLIGELFRQAGRAIMKMPFLLMQPVLTLMILTIVVSGLGFIFLFVETAGYLVPEKNTGFVLFQTDGILKYLKWYYILGFIWIFQFIMGCHRLTVSGAVAIWYFTRDKTQLSYPVLTAIYRVFRYHMGSVALGSLLVTFISFFRLIFSFIDKRLRHREHPVAVFCYSCFQCCLRCFQYFIQYLDSNAYVEIAIHGYGFCFAARRAFRIIVSNALRLAAINSVGDFVLFLGKVSTVSVVVVVGIQLMSTRDDLFYFWLPTTVTAVFAFFISSCFMSVYETTIDTIFVCFCEDLMINNGADKPYFMSVGLMNCMPSRYRPR